MLYVYYILIKLEDKKKSISGMDEMEERQQNALFFERGM